MAIYHRVLSDTQTLGDAVHQVHSSEIWGTVPRHGEFPCVQAYRGALEPQDQGIEFETETTLSPNSSPPGMAYWLAPEAFVLPLASGADSEYVGIKVVVRKIVYRNSNKKFNVECVFQPSNSASTSR